MLETITEGDVSCEGLSHFKAAHMSGTSDPLLDARVSYVGELGRKITTKAEHEKRLWGEIAAVGGGTRIYHGCAAINLLRTGNGRSSLRLDMTSDGAHNDAGLRPAVRIMRIRRWLHRAGCTTLAVKPRSQSQGSGYAYSLSALRACVAPTRRTETRPWRAHRRREGFLGTSPPRRSAANATTDPLQRYRVPTTTHLGLLMASVAKKRSLWYWPERYYPIERPQHESRIIL